MIRTGYLRWEIEAGDARSADDAFARVVTFKARPTNRLVRVENVAREDAAERFARGETSYESVLRVADRAETIDLTVPDVGPHEFRYTQTDRDRLPRFWMTKLQREASAFAHEVVRVAASFPQLVISHPALRAGYARLVEWEIFRVIEGRGAPRPTLETEPLQIDASNYAKGVPELVAAELVRDVVSAREFDEFRLKDRVTVTTGGKHYRISRRPHALIEVWDAQSRRGIARLCVVFSDPGMPPSDEVVMKYLLAKHQPDLLWKLGNKFAAPEGKYEESHI